MNHMSSLAKEFLFQIIQLFFRLRILFYPNIRSSGKLKIFNSFPLITNKARLTIGKETTLINCDLNITDNAHLEIGDRCVLKNSKIFASGNARIKLGEGVILIYEPMTQSSIIVANSAKLFINHHSRIEGEISLRFEAVLTVGLRTGIGFNTSIVCDEHIEIGDYCLISNNVDIYDTNSHSLDHQKRRERIEIGYPGGCSEIDKPNTDPIKIGNDVWIGKKSMILKGSTIGDRCIVGMGSKVTKNTYPHDSVIISEKSKILPIK